MGYGVITRPGARGSPLKRQEHEIIGLCFWLLISILSHDIYRMNVWVLKYKCSIFGKHFSYTYCSSTTLQIENYCTGTELVIDIFPFVRSETHLISDSINREISTETRWKKVIEQLGKLFPFLVAYRGKSFGNSFFAHSAKYDMKKINMAHHG